MPIDTNELNLAIPLYVGVGHCAWPQASVERLVSRFGRRKAEALAKAADEIIDEAYSISVDWSRHSLSSAAAFVGQEILRRHPELTKDAVHAIEWQFSYEWK